MSRHLVRGELLHFLSDPGAGASAAYEHHGDGALLLENGRILRCGPWAELRAAAPEAPCTDHSGCLILPGLIDCHIHYPQTDVIASPGHGLLDWLERYTFPAERRFADPAHAAQAAEFFCDELLRNGTTTALVFGSVHAESVDAFFGVARRRRLRMVAGKVLMDRNCPDYLQDTAQSAYDDSKRLLAAWQGVERLGYALTPRFAITSSEAQLEAVAALAREYPDVCVHSHLAENAAEVDWVRRLFPWSRSYLDVYEHYGLLRPRAVYAHCIHLDQTDRARMAASGAMAAFSPTSNLFLGSGLFDLGSALGAGMRVGIATDVGGGSSFSMLRTLAAAYAVAHLKGYVLSALRAFYLATLSGAMGLGLDHVIGNFLPGKEADFIVLDPAATPLLARRMASAASLEEKLFLWLTLGDDRAIRATYILGEAQWIRPS
ncbi:MAG: guanine deaminase [Rhodocyclaceae bacterium]|nr:guanine deaminase [Rhodocyclaceae bacterium]